MIEDVEPSASHAGASGSSSSEESTGGSAAPAAPDRPPRHPRILHLDSERSWSGGQTQVYNLLRHLARHGHSNAVVSPRDSALSERCLRDGDQIYGVRMRHYGDALSLARLARILRRNSPDVIHMHSSTAHFLGVWARWLSRSTAATVFTRRMDYRLRRAPLMRLPYLYLTDQVVAISQGVRQALIESGIPDRRIAVIHSAVDVERFRPAPRSAADRRALALPETAPVIGVVGGLIRRKGHRYLFEAMAPILRKMPDAALLVVGDGPLRGDLARLAAQLGISSGVRFAGQVADVRQPLACADVLVLPSVAEGLGVSLLEGMAMGLPLVATAVGGIPDAVRDGLTGYLVPPRDPAALAERLLKLLAYPELRLRMGRAARLLAEAEFSSEIMGRRYAALYRTIRNDRPARSTTCENPRQSGGARR